jgi:uncharacterized protein (DUF2147 family)
MHSPALRTIWVPALWIATALAPGPPVYAQAQPIEAVAGSLSSPAGRWKTIDDVTGKAKSVVVIRTVNGELNGTIEKLFDPPVPHPTCYLCSGDLKDRPLVGLQVLWGFQHDGDAWTGGRVLDPESGKIYHASLTLEDGGRSLRLRGYIGVPLLGRTEHWIRIE